MFKPRVHHLISTHEVVNDLKKATTKLTSDVTIEVLFAHEIDEKILENFAAKVKQVMHEVENA